MNIVQEFHGPLLFHCLKIHHINLCYTILKQVTTSGWECLHGILIYCYHIIYVFRLQFYMAHCLDMNFSLMQKIILNNIQNRRVLVSLFKDAKFVSDKYSDIGLHYANLE